MSADTAASSNITSHPFVPRTEWWTVCKVCGLAEAAHAATTMVPANDGTGAKVPYEDLGDESGRIYESLEAGVLQ